MITTHFFSLLFSHSTQHRLKNRRRSLRTGQLLLSLFSCGESPRRHRVHTPLPINWKATGSKHVGTGMSGSWRELLAVHSPCTETLKGVCMLHLEPLCYLSYRRGCPITARNVRRYEHARCSDSREGGWVHRCS
jgi:hypothetical protein